MRYFLGSVFFSLVVSLILLVCVKEEENKKEDSVLLQRIEALEKSVNSTNQRIDHAYELIIKSAMEEKK